MAHRPSLRVRLSTRYLWIGCFQHRERIGFDWVHKTGPMSNSGLGHLYCGDDRQTVPRNMNACRLKAKARLYDIVAYIDPITCVC